MSWCSQVPQPTCYCYCYWLSSQLGNLTSPDGLKWAYVQLQRTFKHHTCNHFTASQDHCCARAQNHTRCILKLFIVLASSFQKSELQTLSSLFTICTQGADAQPFLIKRFSLQQQCSNGLIITFPLFSLGSHSGSLPPLCSRVSVRMSSTQYMYLGMAGCQKSTSWIKMSS